MKYTLMLLIFLFLLGCDQDSTKRISELEAELSKKEERVKELEDELDSYSGQPKLWYAFSSNEESNITKLDSSEGEPIDGIDLEDSVDSEYVFKHTTTISQINNSSVGSFFETFKEYKRIVHSARGNGPMVENTSFVVRTFVVCEEGGLPIETENCTDNIYILVQPTELGYESNLFKVSRLFDTKIKSLEDTDDGVLLKLEHSRYPRKEIKILIKPQLVKFI